MASTPEKVDASKLPGVITADQEYKDKLIKFEADCKFWCDGKEGEDLEKCVADCRVKCGLDKYEK